MPKYTVKTPLHHDGKPYAIGAVVKIEEERAVRLLELGVVAPVEEGPATDIDKMTVAELTDALGRLKVDIPSGAKKGDLIALYSKAIAVDGE
jgi:hypothetical protein